ncbi:MAG: glycosyltransferase [Muribaculaceae bacterium]|nr:glycosyltransferase [Muribaculaceae bacterium]
MNKIDLSNLSILIPVRLDSLDRLENLMCVVDSIMSYCDTNVFILHADSGRRKYLEKLINPKCEYIFTADVDPVFHRTFYINQLFEKTNTEVIAIWDADVIISPSQLQQALRKISEGHYDVCFPYDGTFLNVDNILKQLFYELSYDIDFLLRNTAKMTALYKNVQNGGALLISRNAFINSGMEDESFYGWGPEDWNRVEKWKILGYRIGRVGGPLFHLHHSRDINGNFRSLFQRKNSTRILNTTRLASPQMLSKRPACTPSSPNDGGKSIIDLFEF